MKKPKNIKKHLGIILLLYGMSSCYYAMDDYLYSSKSSTPVSFVQIYTDKDNFLKNTPFVLDMPNQTAKLYNSGDLSYTNGKSSFYADARMPDGTSNWSNPLVDLKHIGYDQLSGVTDKDGKIVSFLDHYASQLTPNDLKTPAAHLHLCLDSWDENVKGEIASKSWIMQSIVDLQGKSLADDPDWTNYTDNVMEFQRTAKFIYTPGAKRSQTELDLFGTPQQHATLFGTYSVKNSGKVTLTLSFPSFTQELEVVQSSWTSLTLKGTVKGKTGIMTLVPGN